MTLYENDLLAHQKAGRADVPFDQSFAIWRVLRPLSHVFIDAPERMIKYGKISVEVMKFIMQKGWPL
jgi:hypothetical protein